MLREVVSLSVEFKLILLIETVKVQNMFALSDRGSKQTSRKMGSRQERCLQTISAKADILEIESSPYPIGSGR